MKQCLSPFTPKIPGFPLLQDHATLRGGGKKSRHTHTGLRFMGNLLAVRVSRSSDCWINGTIKAQDVFVLSAEKLEADSSLTWSIPLHSVERKENRGGMQENSMMSHCVPESH